MKTGFILNGRYKIVRPLGEGGMANVYEAYDLILKRPVTLKMLRLDWRGDPAAIRRFKREAISLTELHSPNIVQIYDVDQSDGMQYLVMEYVEGMDLKKYLKQNYPLSFEHIVAIMTQVLQAVKEAHLHGIIHRDLKPQNILIDQNGRVKITDFGISVMTAETTMTRTNTLLGSVHYISPEQARGSVVTKQSDIYSLGIILFELLTGEVPYQGETAVVIALKHYSEHIPALENYKRDIPQALANVVYHATAKDPHMRYRNIDEMIADLTTALSSERMQEPKWEPEAEQEKEVTKVLPDIRPIFAEKDELEKTKELPDLRQLDERDVDQHQAAQPAPALGLRTAQRGSLRRKEIIIGSIVFVVVVICVAIFAVLHTPRVITVPDVRGMSKADAVSLLKQNHLEIGQINKEHSDKYTAGQVTKSTPNGGAKTQTRSTINITVSQGLPKKRFGNYVGQDFQTVKRKLEAQGVTVYQKKGMSTEYAPGLIIDQSIMQDKKVAFKQTSVMFTVSQGRNTDPSEQLIEFSVPVTVPYDNSKASNKVEVYLGDSKHSYSEVYKTLHIKHDTTVTLPFVLHPDDIGKFKFVRDGKLLFKNDNVRKYAPEKDGE